MASVALETLWLNSAADLSDSQHFDTMNGLVASITKPGEVRRYAQGRRRLVTSKGRDRTHRVSLPHLLREQAVWLEDHVGQVVCARDAQGRKLYAVYFAVGMDERGFLDEATTQLELVEVTVSEEV